MSRAACSWLLACHAICLSAIWAPRDMGSVPGFLQFSWVGPWGAISFPASAVHLLDGNGVPANSRRSKTLRATAVKLVNIQGIEKRVNMIQNQSGVTKMQLNSTFSSSIYPQ